MKEYRHIAIWGLGREGHAGLHFLKKQYPSARFTLIDKAGQEGVKDADFLPENQALAPLAAGAFDLVLKSPGISLYRPEIAAAKEKGTVFTSGTNLWFERYPEAAVVAVTGTKGKSTTASLIHHMLIKCGLHSVLAGNIGTPLLEVLPGRDVTVMELSSYQTADLSHPPEIAVLTNLYEAHLDWHGDRARYHADKMRLFDLSEGTTAIIAQDDETAKKYLRDRENVLFFARNTGDMIIPDHLLKPHNIRNISAALTVVEALNALSHLPRDALADFKLLPHRQETVGQIGGITFINDSISTVPETVVVALEAFHDKPVSLILGGEEKLQDYSCVFRAVEKYGNVKLFCIPDSGKRLAVEADALICKDMQEAVASAAKALPQGGYVILSPGTPSFPIYKNYMDRGEDFRRAFRRLKENAEHAG